MNNGEDQGNRVTYCCSDHTLNHVLSSFGHVPPMSAQKATGVPYSSCENIVSHGKGKASTKFATSSTRIEGECLQQEEDDQWKLADGVCRPQKRRRSAEIHNRTERLRRQRLKQKMIYLQQLIPNCNKRDKASTLDEAINYIKNLQYQLQMMSMGTGFTMFHSPWTMFHSPWTPMSFQQGTQIPSLPPYQQTRPNPGIGYGNGSRSGIEIGQSGVNFLNIGLRSKHWPVPSNSQLGYGIGIRSGLESGPSSVNIPMNQIGSHSKRYSLPSGSQLAQGVSEVQTFQHAGDVSEPLTCNTLDHIIGQYERLVHNGTPRTSSSRWDMDELPYIHSFSEASEYFS